MPTIDRIIETALYFDDLSLGREFYSDLFHFPKLLRDFLSESDGWCLNDFILRPCAR